MFDGVRSEGPFHESLNTVANESAYRFRGQNRQTERLQGIIYRSDQIVTRADQGAIQIEYQQINFLHASSSFFHFSPLRLRSVNHDIRGRLQPLYDPIEGNLPFLAFRDGR